MLDSLSQRKANTAHMFKFLKCLHFLDNPPLVAWEIVQNKVQLTKFNLNRKAGSRLTFHSFPECLREEVGRTG